MSTVRITAPRFSRTTLSAFRPSCSRRAGLASSSPRPTPIRGVPRLDGAFLLQKTAHDFGEVLHVGAKDHGFAQRARLDRVLAALGGQALANEDDGGLFVEVFQFAGAVDNQAIGVAGLQAGVVHHFRAINNLQAARRHVAPDFAAALEVARHQNQEQVGETLAQPEEQLGQDDFFARVRAAGHQEARAGRHAHLAQQRGHVEQPALIEPGGVKLQAAHHMNRLRPAAQLPQPGRIGLVLRADAGKHGEERLEKKAEAPVAAPGAIGQAGVDQEHRDAQFLGAPEKVRPDLRLHQHNGHRANRGQGAVDIRTAVNRVVDLADMVGQLAVQFAHPGGGRRRNDDLEIRQARLQRANQLRADIDFAHADSVHPDRVPIGDGLLEFRAVLPKALAKTLPPIAAPPHSHKVVRRGQDKADREQYVVKSSHSELYQQTNSAS